DRARLARAERGGRVSGSRQVNARARSGGSRLLAGVAWLAALALATCAAVALAQPGIATPARSGPGGPSVAAGRCGACHPAERAAFEISIHAGEDVHCTSCHRSEERRVGK